MRGLGERVRKSGEYRTECGEFGKRSGRKDIEHEMRELFRGAVYKWVWRLDEKQRVLKEIRRYDIIKGGRSTTVGNLEPYLFD